MTVADVKRATSGSLKLVAFVFCALWLAQPSIAQDAYRLGPEDRIRLKVFEWRASRDETFSWEALNDEYSLGSSGELSLPLVGQVEAAGATREELAERIGIQLSDRLGLGRRPSVAVEIVEYRPFFILGPVAEPGAYPYRPGLTVLRAVSLAGGLGTRSETGDRDAIAGQGEMSILQVERDAARARIARLEAELNSAEAVTPPPDLAARSGEPSIAELISQEEAIFETRRDAYKAKLAALEQLRQDLQTEVPAQRAMLENVEMQVRSLREDLNTVSEVVATMQARSMEREVAKLDGERLRVETSLLRAQQEVSRADLEIIDLRTQHALALTQELREVYAGLEQTEHRLETAAALVEQAESSASGLFSGQRRLATVYSIVRTRDQETEEIPAEEVTRVEPGDVIRVELVKPEVGPSGNQM